MGDRGGWCMDGMGDSHANEVGLLHGSCRSMGGAGIGVSVGVNHMG